MSDERQSNAPKDEVESLNSKIFNADEVTIDDLEQVSGGATGAVSGTCDSFGGTCGGFSGHCGTF